MKAIILAAGMGNRLMPLTNDRPKGMVEVNGTPILKNTMDVLVEYKHELTEVIMVVGHKKEKIIEYFSYNYKGVHITYVYNDVYDTTNNIYSLALSLEWSECREDIILFESDVFFEHEVIHRLMKERQGQHSFAVIDAFKTDMDGTVVTLKDGYIGELINSAHINNEDVYKTVNIYYFKCGFFNDVFMPMLKVYMQTHSTNHYYEIVLKAIIHLDYFKIKGLIIDGLKWYEIDDDRDLNNAIFLFKEKKEQLRQIRESWGGYWNFDVVDYNFICNAFFPGEQFCQALGGQLYPLLSGYPSSRSVLNRKAAAAFDTDPDYMMVCNGACEAIKHTLQVFTKPLIVTPNFGEYLKHDDPVYWSMRESENFNLNLKGLSQAATRGRHDAVIITNPNNPTALHQTSEEIEDFLSSLPPDITLILDTSFADFVPGLEDPDLEKYPNLVIIKSLGKTVGLPGIRIGYLKTANRALLDCLNHLMPIWNVNSFVEYFFEQYSKLKKDIQKSIALMSQEKEWFINGLEGIKKNGDKMFTVVGKEANFLFCKMDKTVDVTELADYLYETERILIKDCTDKVQPSNNPYIRLNILQRPKNEILIGRCQRYYDKVVAPLNVSKLSPSLQKSEGSPEKTAIVALS